MKICKSCNVSLDLISFYPRPKGKFGVSSVCKKCTKDKNKLYYINNKENVDVKNKKNSIINRDKYRKTQKLWANKNRKKLNELARNRYNKEKESKRSKEFHKNNPNYRKNYYNENKEFYKNFQKQWKKENPSKVRAYYAKRRLAEINSSQIITPEDKIRIDAIYKKAVELEIETGQKWEVDHIIPLQGKKVCGLHVSWNLQIISMSENRSKGNKIK